MMASLADFIHYDFLKLALMAGIILSFLCGILSPLLVAKRYAFIGESISHSTLLGLTLAMTLGASSLSLFSYTLLFTLFFVMILAYATYRQPLPPDSLIGIFLTGTLAMAILIQHLFLKTKADLVSSLFGNLLILESTDLIILLIVAIIIGVCFIFRHKEWIYYAFDEDGALINSISIKYYHYLFFFLITLLIVSMAKLAGTILVNAFLLIPGIFAYKFSRSMKEVFLYSILFSVSTTVIGLILTNYLETPPGATMAFIQFFIFLLSVFFSKFFSKVRSIP